jgi:predicted O-linked N-acetylglucosamine transferase (SPINDLY family)
MASLTRTINRGVESLSSGRAAEAVKLYRQVLRSVPGHADALHLLAVALYQAGDPAGAVRVGAKSVERRPDWADGWSNQGRYLLATGAVEEAEQALRKAVHLDAGHRLAYFNLGAVLVKAGRREEAAAALREHVRISPDDAGGHHQLGNVLAELRRHAEAQSCFERVVRLQPGFAEAHNNLGNALQAQGRYQDSLEHYRRALELRPEYADACSNRGAALQALGSLDEAEQWYRKALELEPGQVQARGNLANLALARRQFDAAIAGYREVLAEAPDSAESWNNMGNALGEVGRYEEAQAAYDEALRIDPNYAVVHNNRGNVLRRQGRAEEAIIEYRKALERDPQFIEAINNLAVALEDLGWGREAVACFEQAIALRPEYVDPLINLANYWRDHGRPSVAVDLLRRALGIQGGSPYIWNNLGCVLSDLGDVDEGIACWRKAVELMPSNWQAHSNLLLNMHYTGEYCPLEIAEAHFSFGRRFGRAGSPPSRQHRQNGPRQNGQSIRIGYLSADFRRHSVAFFLEPVLERHDRRRFEVFCYSDVMRPDAVTARFRDLAGDGWRDIRGIHDADFAGMVARDRIDLLVETGGHTANSRLLLLAGRVAPVQVSWLGYPNTTGLETMDYRITDAVADPPGETDSWHTEKLVRIPGGFLCFRPPADAPAVFPPPSTLGQPFTYGSFNNMAKISAETVSAWAEILRRAPGTRLAIKNKALSGEETRRRLIERFAGEGIPAGRILMSGLIDSLAGHLEAYKIVDVALDTYPYHGTTTSCEALWMGVPVVSRLGTAHVSRVGASLSGAVLGGEAGGWLGTSREEYIEKAVEWSLRGDELKGLRAGLRERMRQSCLCDETGFTRRLESAYREMIDRTAQEAA